MRRLELLEKEVRESTDTVDENSLNTYELMRYFNDGQKLLQKILYTANQSADLFIRSENIAVTSGVKSYPLPDDIYARNSVVGLMTANGHKITRMSPQELQNMYGYALYGKNIMLSFDPTENLVLDYVYKLPVISFRLAQVDTFDTGAGTIDAVAGSIIANEDFVDRFDYYTIVDSDGNIKAPKMKLSSLAGLTFTFTGDLTGGTDYDGVAAGDYVVCGKFGTSHSELPDECEPFLLTYVQRRILAKISSSDIQSESAFTSEERQDIQDLFLDNVSDALYPVSSDVDYLGY